MPKLPLSLLVAGAAMLNAVSASAASYGPAFFPNDEFFPYRSKDLPNFAGQWHLVNQAPDTVGAMTKNAHQDVNIVGAWAMGVTGSGVVIGIIDDGVEGTHEDLAPNYRADLSKNFSQDAAIAATAQGPIQPTDAHAVSVAGVAAARGGNGIDVTGASPYAQIAGQRISFSSSTTDPAAGAIDIADAFLWDGRDSAGNARNSVTLEGAYISEATISIKNNSWGRGIGFYEPENPTAGTDNLYDKANIQFKALQAATNNNVIFTFAAGNDRNTIGEQAQTRFLNAAEPAINVAALGSDGVFSSYSNFGSSVFVTAPSSSNATTFGITTTDRTGALGYNTFTETSDATTATLTDLPNGNYTSTFGGTSSATPLVSGILALGKQVAPTMDVRLAKHALVRSSRIVDADDSSLVRLGGRGWVTNAAGNSFNANYGFGLIDASKFVNTVIDAAYVTDRTQFTTGTIAVGQAIIVGKTEGVSRTVSVVIPALQNQPLETVEARIKVTGNYAWQDLRIALTSPSGTVGDLLLYNNFLTDAQASAAEKIAYATTINNMVPGFDWVFVANNFWGENANGDWTLNAWNRGFLNIGENIQWDNFELTFNMGRLVFENGSQGLDIAEGVTVKAHSLNLDYAPFNVRAGGKFTVTDSINIGAGTARIYGEVGEAAPETSPEFFKGSLVTVGVGGALFVEDGGTLTATRGVHVKGGDFVNRGTLEIGAGSVTVTQNGSFTTGQNLALQGDIDIGSDGTANSNLIVNTGNEVSPKGTLSTASTLRIGGGLIYAPESITVASTSHINGGRVFTSAYQSGALTLAGGALSADTLAAPAITVNYGILNITGEITGLDGNPTALVINGETDKGKRGWFSPGGIGYIGEDLRGIGNLLFTTKTAGAAAPIPGNITTGRVDGKTVVLRSEVNGSIAFSANGMLLIDVANSPDNDGTILFDTLHATGNVTFLGQLYLNRIADRNGKLPHPKVGHEIVLITSDTSINRLSGGEIDSTYATMSPTLRYDVRTRDWVRSDSNLEGGNLVRDDEGNTITVPDGQLYAIAIRDYQPAAANLTPNQKAVGNMLSTLWYDYQRAKGILSNSGSLTQPPTSNQTQGPVPFPPISRPVNNDIDASPDAPDGYGYEDIFSSVDSVESFDELRALYTHLAPANSIVLEQTLRQKSRAQSGAIRNRARENRASFIQNGSIWTQALFGETMGFNYTQPAGNYDPDHPFTVWLNGGASFTPAKSNQNTAGYDATAYNAAIGADYRLASSLLLGIAFSYSGNQSNFKDSGMKNDSDAVLGAIYAAGNLGGIHYNGLLGYSTDSYTLRRTVAQDNPDLAGNHKGTPKGSTFLASAEIGYEWTTRNNAGRSGEARDNFWSYGPSLALQYYRSTVDSYTEKGDNPYTNWQRLAVGSQTYESLSTQLGFSISRVINLETVTILPEIRASWIHEFKTGEQQISSRLANVPGAESFTIQGNKPTSDYASAGAGITFRLFDSANASLNYDCYLFLKDSAPVHQIAATFRLNF